MTDRRAAIADELLVLGCQEGDAEAFRALVGRWQEPLWRHAFRLTGRDDAAWDVLQDAWVDMARGIHRLRAPGSFRRWAYTIVTRRAADWVSAQRDDPTLRLDETVSVPRAAPSSAVEALRAALLRLPRQSCALLSLRYVDEFELREIAEILGVPEGTVKSRLHHARAALREIIERTDP